MAAPEINQPAAPARADQPVAIDEGIDFGVPARILWRRRWPILIAALLGFAAALTLGFVLPKRYRAEVVMVPASDTSEGGLFSRLGGQLGGLASLAGVDLSGESARKHEALALLKSRAFSQQFIIAEQLMPVLYAKRWDAESGRWKPDGEEPPTLGDAFLLFDKRIRRVSEARTTGLITLSVEWRDRELAARWANRLVEMVNRTGRDRAIREAELSLEYLNRELTKTNVVELREAINRLIEAQINRIMLANVREDYLFRVVDPAAPPDADRFVSPKRLFLALFGALAGGALAAVAFLILAAVQSRGRTGRAAASG